MAGDQTSVHDGNIPLSCRRGNGDGRPDLVANTQNDQWLVVRSLGVLLNDGTEQTAPYQEAGTRPEPTGFVLP